MAVLSLAICIDVLSAGPYRAYIMRRFENRARSPLADRCNGAQQIEGIRIHIWGKEGTALVGAEFQPHQMENRPFEKFSFTFTPLIMAEENVYL